MPPTSRIRPPTTTTLPISNGDFLVVKNHLTAGDQRAMMRGSLKVVYEDGRRVEVVDPLQAPLAQAVAYLLDWSLVDPAGTLISIKGLSDEELLAILDQLPPEDCAEITFAIDVHDDAMRAERAEQKKTRDGATRSSATSPSPDPSGGAMSGSATFPSMSTSS